VRQLTWLQIFCEDGLFSLVDIILTVAVEAFTVKAVMKAFCDTGLVPYNRVIIEDLAQINHQPDAEGYVPTERDQYIIDMVVKGLQKCLSDVKEEVKEVQGKITKCRVRVKKNVAYFAEDILAEDKRRKVEDEIRAKENAEKALKKQEDRKRKREETKKKKAERKQLLEENKAKKEKGSEVKVQRKEINTCKAGCGMTCQTGPQWVGCEHCESFWVCPRCWKCRLVKQQLRKHEGKCKK